MILKAGRVREKKKERKQKSNAELFLPNILVCYTNLQQRWKKDKRIQIQDERYICEIWIQGKQTMID